MAQSRKRRKTRRSRRTRRPSSFYRVVALLFIAAIIVVSSYAVKNFSASAKSHRRGIEALEAGDYTAAISFLSQAAQQDTGNKSYQLDLGLALIKAARYDDALQIFNDVKERGNSSRKQEALRGIGIVCLYQGKYAEAVDVLSQALNYAGRSFSEIDTDIASYLADAQIRNNDPVGAVLTYTRILEQKQDAEIYMLRGLAYQKVGDNSSAEADLVRALEKTKKSYKLYMALYQVYMAQGKTSQAEKLLGEATSLTAKTAEDYSNRGLLFAYMDDYESAAENLDCAIEKGYAPAYFGKAQLYMEQGLYEDAVENFNLYFDQVRDNALAYNQFGVCMVQLGRYEEALSAFSSGLALNDRTVDQELRFNELTATERVGDWAAAYARAQAYVEKYPDDERGQRELAFTRSRQN